MKPRLPRKLKKFYKKEIHRLLEKNTDVVRAAFYELLIKDSVCIRYDLINPTTPKCEVMTLHP